MRSSAPQAQPPGITRDAPRSTHALCSTDRTLVVSEHGHHGCLDLVGQGDQLLIAANMDLTSEKTRSEGADEGEDGEADARSLRPCREGRVVDTPPL